MSFNAHDNFISWLDFCFITFHTRSKAEYSYLNSTQLGEWLFDVCLVKLQLT